jgi:Protein of unknown function (DUF2845)
MNRSAAVAIVLVAGLLAATPAHAFRCGSKLVTEGNSRAEVAAKCGDPTDVDRRSVWRRPVFWHYGRPYYAGNDVVEIPVETWIYNLGPNKLMRRVVFEDGRVKEIETLGYGYHERPRRPRE